MTARLWACVIRKMSIHLQQGGTDLQVGQTMGGSSLKMFVDAQVGV